MDWLDVCGAVFEFILAVCVIALVAFGIVLIEECLLGELVIVIVGFVAASALIIFGVMLLKG